jgi:hypothetical protein
MKDNSKFNLEELLQSKLEQHEVNADHVWNSIAQQLPASSSAGWSAWSKWTTLITGASIAAATAWFVINSNSAENQTSKQNQPLSEQGVVVSKSDTNTVTSSHFNSDVKPTSPENPIQETNNLGTDINGNSESPFVYHEQEFEIPEAVENLIHSNNRNNSSSPGSGNQQSPSDEQKRDLELTAHFTCVPANKNELRFFLFAAQDAAESYQWKISNGIETNGQAVTIQFEEEGEFEITLTVDDGGIKKSETQRVKIFRPAQLNTVNAFAPGIDGKNDTFDVLQDATNVTSMNHFTITSSTGKVVYESTVSSVWDGRTNGELQRPGSYFWFLEYQDADGESMQMKGKIQLFAE